MYRATLPPLPPRPAEPAAAGSEAGRADSVTVPVPAGLIGVVSTQLGLDVSPVPIHRGPAVAELARSMSARAFAYRGEVFLPAQTGPLEDRETQALLVHELVHAGQQRALGGALPTEESAEGQALEATAVAAEQWYRGDTGQPPVLVHPLPAPAPLAPVPSAPFGPLTAPGPGVGWGTLAGVGQADVVQRADGPTSASTAASTDDVYEVVARELAAQASQAPTPAGEPGPAGGPAPTGADLASLVESLARTHVPLAPQPTAAMTDGATVEPAADRPADTAELHESVTRLDSALAELRDSAGDHDLADPHVLDDLATRLYGRLRSRLRTELLVDRERSGMLTDFR